MTTPTPQQAYGAANAGLGIYSGLQRGGVAGTAQAAVAGQNLYSRISGDKALNGTAGQLGSALGIYNGIKQGGVAGYTGAAVNAAKLGSSLGAFGGASGAVGSAAGYAAAPLAVYNAAVNYQSGDTAGDTLRGAEAGAAIGSVVPVIGTVIGGLVGGAVGALSSAFGNGKVAAENAPFVAYTDAFHKGQVTGAQVQNPYLPLAGLFDLRKNQIKGSIPIYDKYGRMGEKQFTTDMTGQINKALANGTIKPGDDPSTIYQKAVAPWIDSMGKWDDSNKSAIQSLLTQMTGQYVSGTAQSDWKDTGGKNTFAQLPQYGQGVTLPGGQPAQQALQQAQAPSASPTIQGSAPGAIAPTSAGTPLLQGLQQAAVPTGAGTNNTFNGLGPLLGAAGAGAALGAASNGSQSNNNMAPQYHINDGALKGDSVPQSQTAGGLFGQLAPSLIGIGGTLIANNQANQGANAAANLSKYSPTTINSPFQQTTAVNGPNGLQYNSTSALTSPFANFANISTAAGNNALRGIQSGNPLSALPGQTSAAYNTADQALGASGGAQTAAGASYLGAGNSVLNAFQGFDPTKFASDQYAQMKALSAPGQTDQTQALLNYEQASGRNGLTQNGQLGDVGGLALAQQTADNGLRLQATQNAQSQQAQLGNLATGLSGQGNNLISSGQNATAARFSNALAALQAGQGVNSNNLNLATGAATGATGINQALLNQLQLSMYGSGQQANAGANAGNYLYGAGNANANSTGNLFGGLQQGLANQGGNFAGLGKAIGGLFGGGSAPSYGGVPNQWENVPTYSQPIYGSGSADYTQGDSGNTTYFGD